MTTNSRLRVVPPARGLDGGGQRATMSGAKGRGLASHLRNADISDEELLRRVASSDPRALIGLYRRYGSRLLAYLAQWSDNRSTAEEILQETLLAIWQSAHTFQGRSSGRAWLYGVARRQAHTRLRRKSREVVSLDGTPVVVDAGPTPEDQIVARAEQDRVRRALDRLESIHREALVLFFLDDLSHTEVADVLGVPVGTVKSRLNHAKRALALLLADDQGVLDV